MTTPINIKSHSLSPPLSGSIYLAAPINRFKLTIVQSTVSMEHKWLKWLSFYQDPSDFFIFLPYLFT
jgi:hypothetical protein